MSTSSRNPTRLQSQLASLRTANLEELWQLQSTPHAARCLTVWRESTQVVCTCGLDARRKAAGQTARRL